MNISPVRGRRGSISVAVLVCLLVIVAICGGLLRLSHAERTQLRAEEHRLQAEWLAESGLDRAAARLGADADYKGETWDVPAGDLGGTDSGSVTIAVEAIDGAPGRRRVLVRADYPREPSRRARVSKRAVVATGATPKGEKP